MGPQNETKRTRETSCDILFLDDVTRPFSRKTKRRKSVSNIQELKLENERLCTLK